MVFGNTGMDDKALFMAAAQGEDVVSQMYPNLTLMNLVRESEQRIDEGYIWNDPYPDFGKYPGRRGEKF